MSGGFIFFLLLGLAQAGPDWSKGVVIPPDGRSNPYQLHSGDFEYTAHRGRILALYYPVEITPALIPFRPSRKLLDGKTNNPLTRLIGKILQYKEGYQSLDAMYERLGLHPFPRDASEMIFPIPVPRMDPEHRMGVTFIHRSGQGKGITFGCAACHSSSLFGTKILGMTNRFPRANDLFIEGKKVVLRTPSSLYKFGTGATRKEMKMFKEMKIALRSVGLVKPKAFGLDTSLAQVSLSLARRNQDATASFSKFYQKHPRRKPFTADSKPAPWWNLKYKNRWLLDGSIVSGNPILTNFLWNEIGRGADLEKLENWIDSNAGRIKDLTTAVFSTQAPRYTDFFPADSISLTRAKKGEALFLKHCSSCHGKYQKKWSLQGSHNFPLDEQLETFEVRYPSRTKVKNVGTDPHRYLGMRTFARELNGLRISIKNGIQVVPQRGYVPPPLVGIWARWPYFHNNSVPSLCAVLTRSRDRPKRFQMREAEDPARDFDRKCNGYPSRIDLNPRKEIIFDTSELGLSARGHDEGIFLRDGRELLSSEDKMAVIEFLKTL